MKIKQILSDILSFNTPQAIVFNISIVFIILIILPTSAIDYSPGKCVFKTFIIPVIFNGNCPTEGIFTNCQCPACGMTHAMSRLLHGDLEGAWNLNKLVFLVFLTMISLLMFNLRKCYKKT